MKSKDGFMVNVAECCFGSCLCLCSRCSLAFCKPALKGSLNLGAPINRAVQLLLWARCGLQEQGDNLLGCLRLHAMSAVCWAWKWI